MALKAPFPYFGGKSKVVEKVWAALGDVQHYIEPFFGSGAVLLGRPGYNPLIPRKWTETICDEDGFVANVWRSIRFSPDETAEWCDWPVNHADLMARKAELVRNENRLLKNLVADPKWHDPVMAGYWIWAASCWIGAGLTCPNSIPHISDDGKGVHCKNPILANKGIGINKVSSKVYAWMNQLSQRLRYVRVVCGDWSRVCGGHWQDKKPGKTVGVFFDPPYGVKDRDKVYHKDSRKVAKKLIPWCRKRGRLENYRIVLAGYEEYEELLESGWTFEKWKTGQGYANTATKNKGKTQGVINSGREKLWFSPHCVHHQMKQLEIMI